MGTTIRRLMKEKHVGLIELAKRTGIGKSKLGDIMSGQIIARPDEIQKIATALGVTIDELKYRADKYRI